MLQLEHTCDVWRNAAVGTNGRKQVAELYTNVSCLLLPLRAETEVRLGWQLGRGYNAFFDIDSDVKTGDQLRRDGQVYTVSSVQTFDTELLPHLEAMCQREVS